MKEELIKIGFTQSGPNANYPSMLWVLYPLKLKEHEEYFLEVDTNIRLYSIDEVKTLWKLITKHELK